MRSLSLALLLFLAPLSAQDLSAPPSKAAGEDWQPLFNGRDLTGWAPVGNESWTVDNGIIHGQTRTQDYGYLQTVQKFRDFDLSLRFRCEADGNSGVFFRAAFKPGTAEVTQGPQFEIDCNIGHHTGGIYDVGRQWLVWPAAENETVIRPREWNEYLLQVHGNRYIARLNGVLMVDYTDPKPRAWYGTIALQLHMGGHGDMLFRDIMIRDLTPNR